MSKILSKNDLLSALRSITKNESSDKKNWGTNILSALKQYAKHAGLSEKEKNQFIFINQDNKASLIKRGALKFLLELFKDETFSKTEPFLIWLQTKQGVTYTDLKSSILEGTREVIDTDLQQELGFKIKVSETKESETKEIEIEQGEDEDEDEELTVKSAPAPAPAPASTSSSEASLEGVQSSSLEDSPKKSPSRKTMSHSTHSSDTQRSVDSKAQEDIQEGSARTTLIQEKPIKTDMKNESVPLPARPSEINVLTKEELGATSKDLEQYIGKKPNQKTNKLVDELGGFKSYMELKAKFKLKSTYKSELVVEELKVNPKDYNDLELGVLYNAYLMNKFEIKELAGFRVGAVIDLKTLIGRNFTLKDLLSVSQSGTESSLRGTNVSVPTQGGSVTDSTMSNIEKGPVQRRELSGVDTKPIEPSLKESITVLQPGMLPQKLINPDTSINSILNKFSLGSHKHTIPSVQKLTEDTKGNVVQYNVNVLSKKKKINFWDRI